MTFYLFERVDQSELVRVEQHSDEKEARQCGCGLSAAGGADLCAQQLSGVQGWPGRAEGGAAVNVLAA